MTKQETSVLKRLLTISMAVIGALFAIVCSLISMMWYNLADSIEDLNCSVQENRERIVTLEAHSDLVLRQ
ncbi:MAG: hypothetical protein GF399_10415 [Candidatus Coatesbacteria bacterium]|jgi:cell division protein FtsL|nr:hypothetical protein [Candidatus Coatesbacteria bacterium]